MHKTLIALTSFSLLFSCCTAQTKTKAETFDPVAVIELFTSEGCSSCPPADKQLSPYAHDSTYHGVKVFTLAFHVDYWNYLGWRDSFSSAANTDRQRMYVDAMGLNGAYTPQAIVNGTTQFVGSDESALQDALAASSKNKSVVAFSKLSTSNQNGKLQVHYELEGDFKNCDIHFALVSLQVTMQVKRGENLGRKLTHTNVVREFMTVKASATGAVTFEPNTLAADNTAIIAYVQRSTDLQIIAAAKVKP